MIKLIYGEKGTGKTRTLVEKANAMAKANYGNVVFIEDSKQSMYDLVRDIRFINIRDFRFRRRWINWLYLRNNCTEL